MLITRRALVAGAALAPLAPGLAFADAPPFGDIATINVRDLAGRSITLQDMVGPSRPLLLSFWAAWCAPCVPEGRHLASVRTRIPEAQLAMLGVNVDTDQDEQRLAQFRERAGMNYLQALADPGVFAVATGLSTLALPRAHLYRSDGSLAAVFAGYSQQTSPAAIDAAVDRVIRGSSRPLA